MSTTCKDDSGGLDYWRFPSVEITYAASAILLFQLPFLGFHIYNQFVDGRKTKWMKMNVFTEFVYGITFFISIILSYVQTVSIQHSLTVRMKLQLRIQSISYLQLLHLRIYYSLSAKLQLSRQTESCLVKNITRHFLHSTLRSPYYLLSLSFQLSLPIVTNILVTMTKLSFLSLLE